MLLPRYPVHPLPFMRECLKYSYIPFWKDKYKAVFKSKNLQIVTLLNENICNINNQREEPPLVSILNTLYTTTGDEKSPLFIGLEHFILTSKIDTTIPYDEILISSQDIQNLMDIYHTKLDNFTAVQKHGWPPLSCEDFYKDVYPDVIQQKSSIISAWTKLAILSFDSKDIISPLAQAKYKIDNKNVIKGFHIHIHTKSQVVVNYLYALTEYLLQNYNKELVINTILTGFAEIIGTVQIYSDGLDYFYNNMKNFIFKFLYNPEVCNNDNNFIHYRMLFAFINGKTIINKIIRPKPRETDRVFFKLIIFSQFYFCFSDLNPEKWNFIWDWTMTQCKNIQCNEEQFSTL